MNLTDLVRDAYKKYRSDVKYNTSLILSEVVAPIGSAALAYICDYSGLGNYLSSIAGGIAGNYLSAAPTFCAAWYFLNKNEYAGKFTKYLKDCGEIVLKNVLPAATSYVIYAPLAGSAVALGASPAISALSASVISAAIFIAGSNIINQRIIRRYK